MQGVAAKNDASYDLSRARASVTGQTTIAASTVTTSLPNGRIVTALFAGALFLSAFLLFVLEPMVAKNILPTLGGTPIVWNTRLRGTEVGDLVEVERSSGCAWLRHALLLTGLQLNFGVRRTQIGAAVWYAHDASVSAALCSPGTGFLGRARLEQHPCGNSSGIRGGLFRRHVVSGQGGCSLADPQGDASQGAHSARSAAAMETGASTARAGST
jgi:hypothetical protein